jgi:hypothetical protein
MPRERRGRARHLKWSELMQKLTRRSAVQAGVIAGSTLFGAQNRAQASEPTELIAAGEKNVLFKVKDVTIKTIDQAARMIAVSVGKRPRSIAIENLPLDEDIKLRISFVFPGVANNLPFSWGRLEELVGKRVSMMLRAEAGGLSVRSVATEND